MLVLDVDFPDPYLLVTPDGYYAYGTQARGGAVSLAFSTDLRHWRLLPDPLAALPEWSRPGFTWSPAVRGRPGRYVIYVAVREARNDRQAIAVAVADHPAGPFVPVLGGPFVFQRRRGGSIDPDPGADGLLVWKSDDELTGRPATLWARALADDGLRLVGRRRRLLTRTSDWEKPLIEAPCLWRSHSGWVLFYSAGTWTDEGYGIGYATGPTPVGPFSRPQRAQAWFAGRPGVAGPGGQAVVQDAAGVSYLAYHAWSPDRIGYARGGARRLHLDRLDLDDLGRPRLTSDW